MLILPDYFLRKEKIYSPSQETLNAIPRNVRILSNLKEAELWLKDFATEAAKLRDM